VEAREKTCADEFFGGRNPDCGAEYRTENGRVAHASRVLATVSRRRELFLLGRFTGNHPVLISCSLKKRLFRRRRRNQHTRRVRYPEVCASHSEAATVFRAFFSLS